MSRMWTRALGATVMGVAFAFLLASSSGAATVVVETLSPLGWAGGNEGPVESVGKAALMFGPGTPPAGKGSVMLEVDDTGRASLGTAGFKGIYLSVITRLTYDTYLSSAKSLSAPALQFDVDYDAADDNNAYQGRLTFSPAVTPAPGAWVTHDALAGTWWGSREPGKSACSQSKPCTWAQVLSAFPNAAIRNDPNDPLGVGLLLFRLGGPVSGGAIANVDNFTIGVAGVSTTFDFEPGATLSHWFGPPGTVVVIEAEGFKPDAEVSVYYYTNVRRPKRVRICKAPAWNGSFYCAVPIPNAAKAGEPGLHDIRIIGPHKVEYTTGFILVP